MPEPPGLYLASRSPRRAELLALLGIAFEVVDVEVDESVRAGESPAAYVSRVARLKATVAHTPMRSAQVVLAADTCVSVGREIFGKPIDRVDAERMLLALAGCWHEVHTAVAISTPVGRIIDTVVATRVEFVAFDSRVIAAYWASGEPADKAGAYGIQGLGGALVRRIEGSYSAVVGLPLAETAALLAAAGIRHALAERA